MLGGQPNPLAEAAACADCTAIGRFSSPRARQAVPAPQPFLALVRTVLTGKHYKKYYEKTFGSPVVLREAMMGWISAYRRPANTTRSSMQRLGPNTAGFLLGAEPMTGTWADLDADADDEKFYASLPGVTEDDPLQARKLWSGRTDVAVLKMLKHIDCGCWTDARPGFMYISLPPAPLSKLVHRVQKSSSSPNESGHAVVNQLVHNISHVSQVSVEPLSKAVCCIVPGASTIAECRLLPIAAGLARPKAAHVLRFEEFEDRREVRQHHRGRDAAAVDQAHHRADLLVSRYCLSSLDLSGPFTTFPLSQSAFHSLQQHQIFLVSRYSRS